MSTEAVSANVWGVAEEIDFAEQAHALPGRILPVVEGWNPEKFAQEQIRSLVRKVFSRSSKLLVRQVVFTAIESETDIRGICTQVVASLATEAAGDVLLVGAGDTFSKIETRSDDLCNEAPLRESATRVCRNLWFTPPNALCAEHSASSLHACLSKIRSEFEYSVIVVPAAWESNTATAMAQFADGLILVLSAGRTRRAAASRIKRSLDEAQVRLLGVVLNDREFPIPDRIYRRL